MTEPEYDLFEEKNQHERAEEEQEYYEYLAWRAKQYLAHGIFGGETSSHRGIVGPVKHWEPDPRTIPEKFKRFLER